MAPVPQSSISRPLPVKLHPAAELAEHGAMSTVAEIHAWWSLARFAGAIKFFCSNFHDQN